MKKEFKTVFEKILDQEMVDLLGKKAWQTWKFEFEPEMYNSILSAMFRYGVYKESEAYKKNHKLAKNK